MRRTLVILLALSGSLWPAWEVLAAWVYERECVRIRERAEWREAMAERANE